MLGTYHLMYDIAKAGLERGVRNVFAPDSAILTGGGMKGVALPDDFMDVIKDFLGVDRIQIGYGFSESSTFHWGCSEGRYHVAPWVIPFVLDPDTSEPLPRTGVQTGRAAVYDILLRAHWGGVISGDEVTIDWDLQCPCGQASVAFETRHHALQREAGRRRRPNHLRRNTRGAQRGGELHEGGGAVIAYTVPLFLRGRGHHR